MFTLTLSRETGEDVRETGCVYVWVAKRRGVVSSWTIIAIHLEKWTHLFARRTGPEGRKRLVHGWSRSTVAHSVDDLGHRCKISEDAAMPLEWSVWTAEKPADDIRDLGETAWHHRWPIAARPALRMRFAPPRRGCCDISQSIAQLRAPDRRDISRRMIEGCVWNDAGEWEWWMSLRKEIRWRMNLENDVNRYCKS